MPKEQNLGKRIILEFLDFIRFKIENDSLTMEEAESIASPTNLRDCCSITNAESIVGSFNLATA